MLAERARSEAAKLRAHRVRSTTRRELDVKSIAGLWGMIGLRFN
jgi:hypothetical protein